MDFSNRSSQPSPAAPRSAAAFGPEPASPKSNSGGKHSSHDNSKWLKGSFIALLVVVALLLASLVGFLLTTDQANKQSDYVNPDKLQAVFLTNDQVYFGKITELNSKFLVLTDIYYLQTANNNSSSTAASNVSLVKLGCELHRPYDKMVVNSSQLQFWENLQDGGQVAKAVAQFKKQNPNGQTCSTSTTGTSTNVQGSTTPTTTTPTTKSSSSNNP